MAPPEPPLWPRAWLLRNDVFLIVTFAPTSSAMAPPSPMSAGGCVPRERRTLDSQRRLVPDRTPLGDETETRGQTDRLITGERGITDRKRRARVRRVKRNDLRTDRTPLAPREIQAASSLIVQERAAGDTRPPRRTRRPRRRCSRPDCPAKLLPVTLNLGSVDAPDGWPTHHGPTAEARLVTRKTKNRQQSYSSRSTRFQRRVCLVAVKRTIRDVEARTLLC